MLTLERRKKLTRHNIKKEQIAKFFEKRVFTNTKPTFNTIMFTPNFYFLGEKINKRVISPLENSATYKINVIKNFFNKGEPKKSKSKINKNIETVTALKQIKGGYFLDISSKLSFLPYVLSEERQIRSATSHIVEINSTTLTTSNEDKCFLNQVASKINLKKDFELILKKTLRKSIAFHGVFRRTKKRDNHKVFCKFKKEGRSKALFHKETTSTIMLNSFTFSQWHNKLGRNRTYTTTVMSGTLYL